MNSRIKRFAVCLVFWAAAAVCLGLLPSPASTAPVAGTVTSWGENTFKPIPIVFPEGVVPVSISAYEYAGGLAITSDGRLFEWFGVADAVPTEVVFPPEVTEVTAVSRRFAHTLALTNNGLYAWGLNHKGQLGDGTTTSRYSTPARVVFPESVISITGIAAGYVHSLAITNDGLYAWGDNFNGELGDGTRVNRSLPVKVSMPLSVSGVTKVAAGRNDSYAITNDGLYAWGNDFAGQLGNGSFGILPDGTSDVGQPLPVKVLFNVKGNPRVTSVTDIAAGEYYALAITNDGLYAWGMNVSGCLGLGTTTSMIALPARVKFPKTVTVITSIAAATNHSLAITNDGLYAWGNNSAGQLGIGNKLGQLSPIKVRGEDNAISVGAAEYSSIALH